MTAAGEEDEGRQSVYIARYGLPEAALVENVGPFDMKLSAEGVEAGHDLGRLLKTKARLKHVFSSPFERALHTASIVANEVGLHKVNGG